jgi:hypothetical protein
MFTVTAAVHASSAGLHASSVDLHASAVDLHASPVGLNCEAGGEIACLPGRTSIRTAASQYCRSEAGRCHWNRKADPRHHGAAPVKSVAAG